MNFHSPASYRYLFLALLVLAQCSKPLKQFDELTAADIGIDFRNDIRETNETNIMTYEYTYNGAGVAAGDLNNDGLADLYFSGNLVPNKLYLNKGDWKFEDITGSSNTGGREDWKTGVTMADINGDGWLDIYVCYSGNAPGEGYNLPVVKDYKPRSNQLFINNGCTPGGKPTFTDVAETSGLDARGTFSTQAYFLDFDLDGDLDMFLLNHANMFYSAFFNTTRLRNLRHPYFGNKLYRNDSPRDQSGQRINLRFTEVSANSGIHGSGLNFGLSAAITDINHDRWPDIYVTNDYEEQDFCYINNRDGTFKEVSHTLFNHLSKFGMGSDVGDINNDGFQDLLVLDMLPEDNKRQKLLKGPDEYDRYALAVDSGYHHQYMRNTLQLNRGFYVDSLPRYSEIGQLSGISNTDWSWSPFIVDLDNDGLKDIFITNGFFRDFSNLDFMKYTTTVYDEARAANKPVDYLNVIQGLPQTRITDYVFKNIDGIQFKNVSSAWGLTRPTVSNGAAYADLDSDGDVDIVTNNLNDAPSILRNNSNLIQKNNFIKIDLVGAGANANALGAKITINLDTVAIVQEAYYGRGYASSVEPVQTIGVGKASTIDEINVHWPDGSATVMKDVKANQLITINQNSASMLKESSPRVDISPLLKDVTQQSGINFRHIENSYIDFKSQRLLYYQLSRLGGKLAKADVNSDGNDDIFFGGAAGQAGQLYLGNDDATFKEALAQSWQTDASCEDIDALFFDADADKDVDLYVVSGGSEFKSGAPVYQDRLYLNDGRGNFKSVSNALPSETTSGSCVVAADFDHDGDQDLFVGGRHTPGSYSLIPRSYLLENVTANGVVKFQDITGKASPALSSVGMVTSALWTDIDNDSWQDLIVVGEWMPVRVFMNKNGKLTERIDKNLEKSNGWWSSIFATDMDKDGDVDYCLGNAGNNLQFKPTEDQPLELYSADFNSDGITDPVICYYIMGKSYPLATRDELLDQIPSLRKKFTKYEDYASATIEDIASGDQLENAHKLSTYTLETSWLENVDGKSFIRHALPAMAQLSSVNAFVGDDFAGQGKQLLLAGNFFPYKPQLGRSDAAMGLSINYPKGSMKVNSNALSNVWLTGDIRDMAVLKFKGAGIRIVVSRNNDLAGVYKIIEK